MNLFICLNQATRPIRNNGNNRHREYTTHKRKMHVKSNTEDTLMQSNEVKMINE